jgi:hypothetical protein
VSPQEMQVQRQEMRVNGRLIVDNIYSIRYNRPVSLDKSSYTQPWRVSQRNVLEPLADHHLLRSEQVKTAGANCQTTGRHGFFSLHNSPRKLSECGEECKKNHHSPSSGRILIPRIGISTNILSKKIS